MENYKIEKTSADFILYQMFFSLTRYHGFLRLTLSIYGEKP